MAGLQKHFGEHKKTTGLQKYFGKKTKSEENLAGSNILEKSEEKPGRLEKKTFWRKDEKRGKVSWLKYFGEKRGETWPAREKKLEQRQKASRNLADSIIFLGEKTKREKNLSGSNILKRRNLSGSRKKIGEKTKSDLAGSNILEKRQKGGETWPARSSSHLLRLQFSSSRS